LQIDTGIAANLAAGGARDLAFAGRTTRAAADRIGTGLAAPPAIFPVAREIDAHVAASGIVWTSEVARAVQADRYAVSRDRASRAAATAIFSIGGEHDAFAVA